MLTEIDELVDTAIASRPALASTIKHEKQKGEKGGRERDRKDETRNFEILDTGYDGLLPLPLR